MVQADVAPAKRILFVDDDQRVLDALRDLLRRQRQLWHMTFATSGEAALVELAQQTFDVVVSDMRMPQMDGVAFLTQVKQRYPATARIVLSGHAEQEMVLRALPVAHQYLAKPCDSKTLCTVIQRACELRDTLGDPVIQALTGKLESLPALPDSYFEISRALADPGVSLLDVTRVVEADPALSAKILQVVNSAFFGLPQKTSSIARAVSYLGLQPIKAIAVSIQVFDAAASASGISGEEFQNSALLGAELARALMPTGGRQDEAFTAALLRDAGRLILALADPALAARASAEASPERALSTVERELFGATHEATGAFLLGTWGLPLPIVTAVAYHHQPLAAASGDKELIVAVHVADALAAEALAYHPMSTLDHEALAELGLSSQIEEWRGAAASVLKRRMVNL
jgi:HD-like signal output (HDOD) protein